eukprot:6188616-Pleurochrysis_carterae.AAC.1
MHPMCFAGSGIADRAGDLLAKNISAERVAWFPGFWSYSKKYGLILRAESTKRVRSRKSMGNTLMKPVQWCRERERALNLSAKSSARLAPRNTRSECISSYRLRLSHNSDV